VFKALPKDALFLEWLAKQPRMIRLEVHALVCNALSSSVKTPLSSQVGNFVLIDDNHDYFVYKTFTHKSNKPD
jgi:hypothetical protein